MTVGSLCCCCSLPDRDTSLMFTYTEFFVAHSHILVVFSHAAIMLLGRMNVWKNP